MDLHWYWKMLYFLSGNETLIKSLKPHWISELRNFRLQIRYAVEMPLDGQNHLQIT